MSCEVCHFYPVLEACIAVFLLGLTIPLRRVLQLNLRRCSVMGFSIRITFRHRGRSRYILRGVTGCIILVLVAGTDDKHDKDQKNDDWDDGISHNESINVVGIRGSRNTSRGNDGDTALAHNRSNIRASRTRSVGGTVSIGRTPATGS